MKHTNITIRLLHTTVIGSACLTFTAAALLAHPAEAEFMTVPDVPAALAVPPGNRPYLRAAAAGTQNYLCMPSGWTFVGPQATLFFATPPDRSFIRQQIATHFLSPNPDAGGAARATWQSSFDTSSVWAVAIASSSDRSGADSVPWLLLQTEGTEKGPMGGSTLSESTYIQRINTSGGVVPTTSCILGARAFVPYTAEYVFYRKGPR